MKKSNKTLISLTIVVTLSAFTLTMSAQETNQQAYEKAKNEIVARYGFFPQIFDAYPEIALPGAWETFKVLTGPGTSIEPKNKELIMMAVASQVPCQYCLYVHQQSAKAYGASDQELEEAVALAGLTRQWSTVVQGAQIDLDEFKKEFDQMMDYAAKQAKMK